MFMTCKLEDSVRILPSELGKETLDAVTTVLELSYLDKVVPDCGLVVSIFEISKIEGGFIYHSEGVVHFNVHFTLVIFRPLLGELLVGTLKRSSNQDGGNDDSHQMYMEEGSEVRLRVKDVKLNTVPTVKQLRAQGEELLGTSAQPFVPMEILGVINEEGLGCTDWWIPAVDET